MEIRRLRGACNVLPTMGPRAPGLVEGNIGDLWGGANHGHAYVNGCVPVHLFQDLLFQHHAHGDL